MQIYYYFIQFVTIRFNVVSQAEATRIISACIIFYFHIKQSDLLIFPTLIKSKISHV